MNLKPGFAAAKSFGEGTVKRLAFFWALAAASVVLVSAYWSTDMVLYGIMPTGQTMADSVLIRSAISRDSSAVRKAGARLAFLDSTAFARGETFSTRIIWGTMANLYALVMITALLVLAGMTYRAMKEETSPDSLFERNLTMIAMGFLPWATLLFFSDDRIRATISGTFLAQTVEREFSGIFLVVQWIDGSALAACITVAAFSGRLVHSASVSRKPTLALLERRFSQLQILLYASSAILVTHLFQLNSLVHWGLDYFPNAKEIGTQNLHKTMLNLLAMRSIYEVLCVAAVYVPSVLYLRSRINQVSSRSPAEGAAPAPSGTLPSIKWSDVLPRVLALLSPLLTGPIVELIKFLSSAGG
jgi:hypothetical protein